MLRKSKEKELKVCQLIKRNLAAMGFTPNYQKNNSGQWSFGQIFGVAKYCIDIISIGAYVFFEASTPDEYMLSIFELNASVSIMVCFVSIACKNDQVFEIISQCAKELTISKFKSFQNYFFYI